MFVAGASCHVLNDRDETPLEVAKNALVCRVMFGESSATKSLQFKCSLVEYHTGCRGLLTSDASDTQLSSNSAASSLPGAFFRGRSGCTLTVVFAGRSARYRCLCNPFQELPPGPITNAFWMALGVGKDSLMFQSVGVFPFDRLNDTGNIDTVFYALLC